MRRLLLLLLIPFSFCSIAAERKPIEEVDTDYVVEETQILIKGAGESHMAMVWWIPYEFWIPTFRNDPMISTEEADQILEAMEGVSLLAVIQADISMFGAFSFFPQDEIRSTLDAFYVDGQSERLRLTEEENINPDLEILIGALTPILAAAMGETGQNMHFFVMNDYSPKGERLIDPYELGEIEINLNKLDGTPLKAIVELPLNSLYEPRICPNGKEAHVRWNFCPWSGEELD